MAEKVLREAINIDPTAFEAWWVFVCHLSISWIVFVHKQHCYILVSTLAMIGQFCGPYSSVRPAIFPFPRAWLTSQIPVDLWPARFALGLWINVEKKNSFRNLQCGRR